MRLRAGAISRLAVVLLAGAWLAGCASDVSPSLSSAAGPDTAQVAAPLGKMRPVSPAMLRDPAPGDWLQWGRTYDGQNFSPLKRIDRSNVANLAQVWRSPVQAGLSMPTPLVHDGVMFLQTSPDTVLALDAATGVELWRHAHKVATGISSTMKMGLALSGGRVFVPTSDLHVLALDAKTGATVWDQPIEVRPPATVSTTLGLRSAPLIVGDKVIQGVTTSFVAGGGYIVALDINTVKEIWRFNSIARPGEPGGETWNGLPLEKRFGGSVWHQGTYDRDLNLIYYGVAPTYDTAPLRNPSGIPGTTSDALYTNSTIALNPDTGKLVWHYQHFANDQWDLDWVFERQIVTVRIGGRNRKVVMNVGKMGILDAVDAATGAYVFSIDAGTQNIITAVDPVTGAKTIDPQRLPDPTRPTVYCPGPSGGRSWPPTSYSKNTGLLYVPVTEWCMRMSEQGARLLSAPGSGLSAADHPDATSDGKMGRLQAMDLSGRKLGWKHDLDAPLSTSALATAGGVVFAGDLDPALKAFDDRDGKLLWSAPLDNYPSSSVITYSVGQTQYVAVVVGMNNNHIGDQSRRYQAFRRARGAPAEAPKGGPAVVVFALGARSPG
ncbi:MAG: PQQ-binding-like beta-propeller repeat protein [Hyphomonadaceae bacterium]|nr:PQQ-binding-like beta-propeller repeat protein [Hyphomonadaceae bacterium]